jgi:hypothetical protein
MNNKGPFILMRNGTSHFLYENRKEYANEKNVSFMPGKE